MAGRPPRRFDFTHVERALAGGDLHVRHRSGNWDNKHPVLACYVADRLGVPPTYIHRWRQTGLTAAAADRIAIALDRHPAEIWPDFYEEDMCCT